MTSLRPGRFGIATAVSLGLVLSAPIVGQIRAFIRREFPGHFVLIVGIVIAAGLSAALLAAGLRIRDRRAQRYGALVAALLIGGGYAAYRAGDNPESNVVELFHFLQYGLITFLFYRAGRPLGDLASVLMPVFAGLVVGSAEGWFLSTHPPTRGPGTAGQRRNTPTPSLLSGPQNQSESRVRRAASGRETGQRAHLARHLHALRFGVF